MHSKMQHHHWEIIKTVLVETVWDQVNAINLVLGSIYMHFFVFLGIMALAGELAHAIQVLIGIACGGVLLAYNCLKFYRLLKSKESED